MSAVRIRRVLDPSERTAEVLFGLIMVLTFTGSLSVVDAGRADVREMLLAALGCNLAWGIIDGVLYLMTTVAQRSRPRTLIASDWTGALAVCLLVFASTFPVALPFVFIHDVSTALRVSNAAAVGMLFLAGTEYGRAIDLSPWLVGACMVLLGASLVALTIALGG
jgi:VIT1/CCC1 family predicted Fe2+/Mn2+ transporter